MIKTHVTHFQANFHSLQFIIKKEPNIFKHVTQCEHRIEVRSHVTYLFVSRFATMFNVASTMMQRQMLKIGLLSFSAFVFM